MSANSLMVLIPVVLFVVAMLGIGFYIQKKSEVSRKEGYAKDYYIGGRSLGGFVLAMTLVATYGSVSSFVGGPGMAWDKGFGWVYYASTQVVAAFLVLGVIGKKIAVVSRRLDAVTIVDVIRDRYQSDILANVSAVIIVVFFAATMVAQFVGGAWLFEAATGYSYIIGLAIFGVVVILYTTVGGFKAVAITDTACAIMMIIGIFVIAYGILHATGGFAPIMEIIKTEAPHMLEPNAGGKIPTTLFMSQWLLCGVCTIGLPQSAVRGMGYKDTQSLHKAMFVGTIVVGFMMVGMHLLGVLSRGVITDTTITNTDTIMPKLIMQTLHPIVAGVAIIGPIAATMSTVSSLLIAASSSIVKDVYMHYQEKANKDVPQKKIAVLSNAWTALIGITVFIVALKPPSLIVWINMFAFGGLQSAFFFSLLFGLFWKKANATGALWSMVGGTLIYCTVMALKVNVMGFHNIVWGISSALVLFIIGSYVGKPIDDKVGRIFFPEKY